MKALVGAFNYEKAQVEAFSVIVQLHRLIVYNTSLESAELIRAQNNSQYIQQRMKGRRRETRVWKICYKRMKMCFLILNFSADAQKVDR